MYVQDECNRPYKADSTITRPIYEVKQLLARIVLRWVTTGEVLVLITFCFFIFHFVSHTSKTHFLPYGFYLSTTIASSTFRYLYSYAFIHSFIQRINHGFSHIYIYICMTILSTQPNEPRTLCSSTDWYRHYHTLSEILLYQIYVHHPFNESCPYHSSDHIGIIHSSTKIFRHHEVMRIRASYIRWLTYCHIDQIIRQSFFISSYISSHNGIIQWDNTSTKNRSSQHYPHNIQYTTYNT